MSKVHILYTAGKGDSTDRVLIVEYPNSDMANNDLVERCEEGKYWVRGEIITIAHAYHNANGWIEV